MTFYKMHTEDMKQYHELDANATLDTYYQLAEMEQNAGKMKTVAEESFLYAQIKSMIEDNYDLGKVEEIYEIFGGYINKSFGVYTVKDGERHTWFFRKYMRHKDLNELMMEHKLLLHARANGFTKGAAPIPGRDGSTYYATEQKMEDGFYETWYFAVYEFIKGYDTYDWVNNDLPAKTYESIAVLYAELHNAVRDLDPEPYARAEGSCNVLMTEFPADFRRYLTLYEERGYNNCFSQFFEEQQGYIKEMCQKAIIPADDFNQLPICPLQCDFHPANVKYDEDGIVTGIFDFDWAKMDVRIFELGLGMTYCFSSWNFESDGDLKLNDIINFMTVYNNRLAELNGLTTFTDLEKKYFFEALLMGTLYLVRWASEACYKDISLNPYEYLYYMQHEIRVLKWIESHEDEIREATMNIFDYINV